MNQKKTSRAQTWNFSVVNGLVVIFSLLGNFALAQHELRNDLNIEIGPQYHISSDLSDLPHVEPIITVNPNNPNHLAGASMVIHEPFSNLFWDSWTLNAFVTEDAGKSWTRVNLPGLENTIAGDPWMVWGNDGSLYLSCLVRMIDSDSKQKFKVWFYRSEDGGYTWSDPEQIPFLNDGSVDHPVLQIMDGEINIMATSGLSKIATSVRRPETNNFEPLSEYHPDNENNNLGSAIGLADGKFVFSYYSMSAPEHPGPLWAVRSDDYGQTFQRSAITPEHIPVGFPMMTIDRSESQWSNRIYSVWVRSFEKPYVELAFSDDNGASWSDPRRVHANSSSALRATPNVAVSKEGAVAVVWVDSRHHEEFSSDKLLTHLKDENGIDCWDVYASVSLDGGETFYPEIRLSPETTCSNAKENGQTGRRWRWGGDYLGVVWNTEKSFFPIWIDSRTGLYQVWTTKMQIN